MNNKPFYDDRIMLFVRDEHLNFAPKELGRIRIGDKVRSGLGDEVATVISVEHAMRDTHAVVPLGLENTPYIQSPGNYELGGFRIGKGALLLASHFNADTFSDLADARWRVEGLVLAGWKTVLTVNAFGVKEMRKLRWSASAGVEPTRRQSYSTILAAELEQRARAVGANVEIKKIGINKVSVTDRHGKVIMFKYSPRSAISRHGAEMFIMDREGQPVWLDTPDRLLQVADSEHVPTSWMPYRELVEPTRNYDQELIQHANEVEFTERRFRCTLSTPHLKFLSTGARVPFGFPLVTCFDANDGGVIDENYYEDSDFIRSDDEFDMEDNEADIENDDDEEEYGLNESENGGEEDTIESSNDNEEEEDINVQNQFDDQNESELNRVDDSQFFWLFGLWTGDGAKRLSKIYMSLDATAPSIDTLPAYISNNSFIDDYNRGVRSELVVLCHRLYDAGRNLGFSIEYGADQRITLNKNCLEIVLKSTHAHEKNILWRLCRNRGLLRVFKEKVFAEQEFAVMLRATEKEKAAFMAGIIDADGSLKHRKLPCVLSLTQGGKAHYSIIGIFCQLAITLGFDIRVRRSFSESVILPYVPIAQSHARDELRQRWQMMSPVERLHEHRRIAGIKINEMLEVALMGRISQLPITVPHKRARNRELPTRGIAACAFACVEGGECKTTWIKLSNGAQTVQTIHGVILGVGDTFLPVN